MKQNGLQLGFWLYWYKTKQLGLKKNHEIMVVDYTVNKEINSTGFDVGL